MSIRSPATSNAVCHSARLTTLPLIATARNRAPGSIPCSFKSSATAAAASSVSLPLILSCIITPSSRLPADNREPRPDKVRAGETLGRKQPSDLGHPFAQYIGADDGGGDRGQQDPVAVMARRDHEPVEAARAKHRRVVTRARPETDPGLGDRQFLDRRDRAPSAFDESEETARGQARVEAALLDGAADDEASVAPWHEIPVRQP